MPPVNSVDIGLMQKKRLDSLDEQNRAASELRGARRPSVVEPSTNEGMTLRQQVMTAAKSANKLDSLGGGKGKAAFSAGGGKVNTGTAQLLKASWLNVIDSFGATLIYINFHAIARLIPGMRGMFCKLGEEWLPKGVSAQGVPALEGKIKKIGLLEKMLLFLVDFLLLLVVAFVCFVLFIIIDFATANWMDKAYKVFTIFKDIVF